MFCYQCEQTAKGTGCNVSGVCGKDPKTADLQDTLLKVTMGVSQYAHELRKKGIKDKQADIFVMEALFTTVTNVNFDPETISAFINKGMQLRDTLKAKYSGPTLTGPAAMNFPKTLSELETFGSKISTEWATKKNDKTDDITSLKELITYGLKGMAAYMDHAHILGLDDDNVYAFFHEALSLLNEKHDLNEHIKMVDRVGAVNLDVMALLDKANTQTYGDPVPTKVRITPIKGKAILVSGHDLLDLEELLKQTEGKGINVYTHGEMLPCNGYPGLKKYKHLAGNYGGAWQDQQKEFAAFPGSILMTTNCLQRPTNTYKDRIFNTGLVQFPGITHVDKKDFSPVIKAALNEKGFEHDEPEKYITVGFGHNAVMGVAGKVIDAVKAGKIKHFFLIGGCDGAKPGRNYYTEFAESVPKDSVILTLACGKYRFNKLEFGDIEGIPRLLDIGQCNDSYSAIQIAVALAAAFNTDVNSLPLSLILSWYEQKAIVVLLTLLHVGIKNIKIGPSLPAFLTPTTLNFLVENYGIKPITTPAQDLKEILG
ncbi:MAG: hydroxylamine reductase [bacterium]